MRVPLLTRGEPSLSEGAENVARTQEVQLGFQAQGSLGVAGSGELRSKCQGCNEPGDSDAGCGSDYDWDQAPIALLRRWARSTFRRVKFEERWLVWVVRFLGM